MFGLIFLRLQKKGVFEANNKACVTEHELGKVNKDNSRAPGSELRAPGCGRRGH